MFGKLMKISLGIAVGALVGAAVASLLTPKSGDEIRGDIRSGFDEIKLDYEIGKQQKREDLEADLRRRCGEE